MEGCSKDTGSKGSKAWLAIIKGQNVIGFEGGSSYRKVRT